MSARLGWITGGVLASLTLLVSHVAYAADGAAPNDEASHTPRGSAFDSLVEPESKRSWAEGSRRLFVATALDVGFLYVRPRVALGFGKPHNTWIGIDGNPTIAGPGAGMYGGLRLSVPHFDIRVGARHFSAFQHAYLRPRASYDRVQLESTELGSASIDTLETEANADIPAGPGDVLLLASASHVSHVPDGQNVFEETLRVVVVPPWVVRGRLGYSVRFGAFDQISVGIVADVVAVPARQTAVVRVGPILRFALSRSFEVRGSFVPRVYSPDDLGLLDSDFTELGLRWRWASE